MKKVLVVLSLLALSFSMPFTSCTKSQNLTIHDTTVIRDTTVTFGKDTTDYPYFVRLYVTVNTRDFYDSTGRISRFIYIQLYDFVNQNFISWTDNSGGSYTFFEPDSGNSVTDRSYPKLKLRFHIFNYKTTQCFIMINKNYVLDSTYMHTNW